MLIQYFHNSFTINIKYPVVISYYSWGKNNFSSGFKLKPVTTYHIRFVVKMLLT